MRSTANYRWVLAFFTCFAAWHVVPAQAVSQDLVVTVNGDSIVCKVVGFSDDSLFYSVGEPVGTDGKAGKRLALHQADVFVYHVNYQGKLPGVVEEAPPPVKWQRFRLAANLGVAYRIDPDGNSGTDRVVPGNKMYLTTALGGDLTWLFSPHWGLGVTYGRYVASDTYTISTVVQGPGYSYLSMQGVDDRLTLTYLGAMIVRRKPVFKDQSYVYTGLSVGPVLYDKDRETSDWKTYTVTGTTLGGQVEFGLDSRLNKYLSIGAKLSVFAAWINTLTWDDGYSVESKPVQRIDRDLHRFDLSIGMRVHL